MPPKQKSAPEAKLMMYFSYFDMVGTQVFLPVLTPQSARASFDYCCKGIVCIGLCCKYLRNIAVPTLEIALLANFLVPV